MLSGPFIHGTSENGQQAISSTEQASETGDPLPVTGSRPIPEGPGDNGNSGNMTEELPPAKESAQAMRAAATVSPPIARTGSAEGATARKTPMPVHEAVDQISVAEKNPPDTLGWVTLGNRETLWRLVEKVYGSHDPRYLRLVQKANPHIRDLDQVEVGDQIVVPAIPARVRLSDQRRVWVRLAEARTLDSAVDMLRNHPPEAPPIRVVPHWDYRNGLSFSVLLKSVHFDDISAQSQSDRLTRVTGTTPELVSSWAPDSGTMTIRARNVRMGLERHSGKTCRRTRKTDLLRKNGIFGINME